MSFSLSLSNALSGLTVTRRGVDVVSSNVANALTEGYAARELLTSTRVIGGEGAGVKIDGIGRRVDPVLTGERRAAQASVGQSETRAGALAGIESAIGNPTEPGSLTERIAALEAALVTASSRPDSTIRLDDVVTAAGSVVDQVRSLADAVATARQDADSAIARDVETINTALVEIQDLDTRIFTLGHGDRDVTALLDQRQSAVDRIASLVPIRELPRDGGKIALVTEGGALLYDERPLTLGFTPRPAIQPDFTLAAGDLSGLTLNGLPVTTGGDQSIFRGGALAAHFALRDEIMPGVQSALDSVARDLVERFQDPALDTSLAVGDPGLFTDGGAAFVPADEIGLSGRLELNALVDPDQGGESWRIRDGLGAAAPGDVGNATLLNALVDRLGLARAPASGPFAGTSRSLSGLAAEFLSFVSGARQTEERVATYDNARLEALRSEELRNGVDTDAELQRLLQLEQAYAANAQVIRTLDELMNDLLRI